MPDLIPRYCEEHDCGDLIPMETLGGKRKVKSVYDRLHFCHEHAKRWGCKRRDRILRIELDPRDLWLMGKPLNLEYWYI